MRPEVVKKVCVVGKIMAKVFVRGCGGRIGTKHAISDETDSVHLQFELS